MASTFNDIQNTFKKGNIFTKLIMVNVAAFIIYWILTLFVPGVRNALTIPGSFSEVLYQPWTTISYMFLHEGFLHLLFNMLWLFWFGRIFLQFLHDKQLLAVYLIGGFAGAFVHLGVNEMLPPEHRAGIVGASAAVMAVVFAAALYKPDFKIHLLFIGPVKIKYVAYVALALDIMGALQNLKEGAVGGDGVAHIAHMGGALYGIWFALQMRKGKDITRKFNNFLDDFFTWVQNLFNSDKKQKPKKTYNRFQKPKSDWEFNKNKAERQKEVDRILDKISQSGYDSLSKKEKEFLFKFKDE